MLRRQLAPPLSAQSVLSPASVVTRDAGQAVTAQHAYSVPHELPRNSAPARFVLRTTSPSPRPRRMRVPLPNAMADRCDTGCPERRAGVGRCTIFLWDEIVCVSGARPYSRVRDFPHRPRWGFRGHERGHEVWRRRLASCDPPASRKEPWSRVIWLVGPPPSVCEMSAGNVERNVCVSRTATESATELKGQHLAPGRSHISPVGVDRASRRGQRNVGQLATRFSAASALIFSNINP